MGEHFNVYFVACTIRLPRNKTKRFPHRKRDENFTRVLKETLHREWPRGEKYNMWR